MLRTALATTLSFALIASAGAALAGAPAAPPVKDPKAAPAGAYKLDENHIGVVARVPHSNGTSYSIFRFDKAHGTLNYDAAAPANIKLDVTVEPGSINSNVAGFATTISGDRFLKSATFATAQFVSTGVQASGTHATINGNLTFMGQTKPATINADLVAVGRSQGGKSVIGFTGSLKFKRSDFGFTAMVGPIGDDIEVLLDGEFGQL